MSSISRFTLCISHVAYSRRYHKRASWMYIYLSTYLFLYLSIYLPIYLFIYLSIYLSTYLSIYLLIYLFIYISTCLSICFFICLSLSKLFVAGGLLRKGAFRGPGISPGISPGAFFWESGILGLGFRVSDWGFLGAFGFRVQGFGSGFFGAFEGGRGVVRFGF